MAIVIIGGLITSTFLSLLVIPVIFTIIDDWREFVMRRVFRIKAPAAAQLPELSSAAEEG